MVEQKGGGYPAMISAIGMFDRLKLLEVQANFSALDYLINALFYS